MRQTILATMAALSLCVGGCAAGKAVPGPESANSPALLTEIAGTYHEALGLASETLILGVDGRFTSELAACPGPVARARGSVLVSEDQVLLVTEEEMPPGSRYAKYHLYYPVRWGARLYLVESTAMCDFCRLVRRGVSDLNRPGSFLREVGARSPVNGLPEVPIAWHSWLEPERRATPDSPEPSPEGGG